MQIFRPKASPAGLARVCAWLAGSSELADAAARPRGRRWIACPGWAAAASAGSGGAARWFSAVPGVLLADAL